MATRRKSWSARPRLAVAAAALVLLSACRVSIDVVAQVRDDGSGTMSVAVLLGETVRGTLQEKDLRTDDPRELAELEAQGEDVFERGENPVDLLLADVPEGWRGERITEGKSEGVRLETDFDSLDELDERLQRLQTFGDGVAGIVGRSADQVSVAAVVRGLSVTQEGSVFRFRAEPDLSAYEGATGGSNNLLATFTISLRLPGGIREHDADQEEDGVLTWAIPPGESRTISATSDLTHDPSSFPVLPVVLGGGAAVAAVGGWWALRRRGAGDAGEPPPDEALDDEPVLV